MRDFEAAGGQRGPRRADRHATRSCRSTAARELVPRAVTLRAAGSGGFRLDVTVLNKPLAVSDLDELTGSSRRRSDPPPPRRVASLDAAGRLPRAASRATARATSPGCGCSRPATRTATSTWTARPASSADPQGAARARIEPPYEPDALIPWGIDESGNVVWWLTTGATGRWSPTRRAATSGSASTAAR